MRHLLATIVIAPLISCSSQSGSEDPSSWILRCRGVEQIKIEKEGVDQGLQSDATATIYYRWDDRTKTLVTEHDGAEPAIFCRGAGQEKCSVRVEGSRLRASSFDLAPGKQPGTVTSFGEEIDIDLTSLVGTTQMVTSTGTLTDTEASVSFKAEVMIPLRCERSV